MPAAGTSAPGCASTITVLSRMRPRGARVLGFRATFHTRKRFCTFLTTVSSRRQLWKICFLRVHHKWIHSARWWCDSRFGPLAPIISKAASHKLSSENCAWMRMCFAGTSTILPMMTCCWIPVSAFRSLSTTPALSEKRSAWP